MNGINPDLSFMTTAEIAMSLHRSMLTPMPEDQGEQQREMFWAATISRELMLRAVPLQIWAEIARRPQ